MDDRHLARAGSAGSRGRLYDFSRNTIVSSNLKGIDMTNQNVLVIDRVERYGIEMFRPVLVTIDSIGMVVGETKLGTSFFTEAGARTWVFETLRKDAQKRLSTYSNPQAG